MPGESAYAHREHWSARGTWNRDRIIAALRDWGAYTGSPPRSYEWAPSSAAGRGMTTARVRLWKHRYPRWPSTATVCSHFGRWSVALKAAGLKPHRQIAPGEGRTARVFAAQRLSRDGMATRHIADILEVSPRTARAYLTAGQCEDCGTPVITANRCPRCAARHAARPRFTRAQILHAIRAWTEETGRSPRAEEWSPSSDPRRKWAREYPRWPSGVTVRTHFGSWTAALEAAGQSANRLGWDRPSIVQAFNSLAIEAGRPPMTEDLKRPDMPAPGTVRHHFGSLAAALTAAGYEPRRRRWQAEEILEAVASFEDRHARLPEERDWNRATTEHPHASTVRQRFGSWRELISAHRSGRANARR
jgi:predicted Zn-ribbon and HTH transcriptional regulator